MVLIKNHAINLDERTLQQMKSCADQPFVVDAALMPDAHAGYVAPIGAILVTKGVVVPSWVGFDIGCGMTAVKITTPEIFEKIQRKKQLLYDTVKTFVPMGMGKLRNAQTVTEESIKTFTKLVMQFEQKPYQKNILNLIKSASSNHLGTLGDGNHFIELCVNEDNNSVWIVVHCGSRGIGYKLAQHYMKIAAKNEQNFEQTFALDENTQDAQEYLNVLEFGLEFALLNRLEIIRQTITAFESVLNQKIEWELWTNKNHNHVIFENELYIHRKGATPAKKGERGVIPGTMKDGSFLVEGLGNNDFIQSSSHGAGRLMGRVHAKKTLTLDSFQQDMKDIVGTISQDTLDEAPQAYKNIYEVMDLQKESVKIIQHLKPLINWKGTNKHG